MSVRGVSGEREARVVNYSERTRTAGLQVIPVVVACVLRPADVDGGKGVSNLAVNRAVLRNVGVHERCGTVCGGVAEGGRRGRRARTEGERAERGVERAK